MGDELLEDRIDRKAEALEGRGAQHMSVSLFSDDDRYGRLATAGVNHRAYGAPFDRPAVSEAKSVTRHVWQLETVGHFSGDPSKRRSRIDQEVNVLAAIGFRRMRDGYSN